MDPTQNLQPTDAELHEAAEQADAGHRLAFPLLFDGGTEIWPMPSSPVIAVEVAAEIPAEAVDATGSALGEASGKVHAASMALPLEGAVDIHLRLQKIQREITEVGAVLAERRGS